MRLVLGVDIGGTGTRALVTTLDGTPVGSGRAGAANPVSVPAGQVAANLATALGSALSDVDVAAVEVAVVGAAGGSRSGPFERAVRAAGVAGPLRVVGDAVTAFAAGPEAACAGTVVICGTGAVAAEVREDALVRVADGLGWLLGDLGSGFWIGRAAATATADALYAGAATAPLARAVLAAVDPGDGRPPDADRFVTAVYDRPPTALAGLAPLVARAARAGDPVARRILRDAATHLFDTVSRVRRPGDATRVVLAGGVLRHCPEVSGPLVGLLRGAWPGAPVGFAGPGEVGAARIAARIAGTAGR